MRKRTRSNKKWLYIGIFIALLFISVGYSFFSENLTLKGTGIIGEPPKMSLKNAVFSNEAIVTSGEGLYHSEDGNYHFRGNIVNNYVSFNNEIWRIVFITSTGNIKLIKNSAISSNTISSLENISGYWSSILQPNNALDIKANGKLPFDVKGERPNNKELENSYCNVQNNGCNAYSTSPYNSMIIDKDSSIKSFLNNDYYQSINQKEMTTEYILNLGLIKSTNNISSVINLEKEFKSMSNVGLANISDYVLASINENCQTEFDSPNCNQNNWMFLQGNSWYLLNGNGINNNEVWTVTENGKIMSADSSNYLYIRPAVMLKNNISVTGSGTANDPYILGENL